MNLSRQAVFPIVCVAAITVLSGCVPLMPVSGPSTPAPSAEALAPELDIQIEPDADALDQLFANVDVTRPSPDGPMDKWVSWTSGRDEVLAVDAEPYLTYLSGEMGVEGLESTNDAQYMLGYIAVAPFGDYCIVALYADELSASDGAYAASIQSRINDESVIESSMSSDYPSLGTFANHFRDWCNEGGDWPGMPPLEGYDPAETSPGINA